MPRSDTRERIVEEALRLFARQGYEATSVAQIERAAGLKPGAGGMYAHFESKEEVLAAAIERSTRLSDAGYSFADALPLGDLRSELTLIARGSFVLFDGAADWLKVRLKEGDQFPELFAGGDRLGERAYRWLANWLASKSDADELVLEDTEALADVLFGGIGTYWLETRVFGRVPNGVSEDRFVAAWVDLALGLCPSGPPAATGSTRRRRSH